MDQQVQLSKGLSERDAQAATSNIDQKCYHCLRNQAMALAQKYEQTRAIEELEEAIFLMKQAINKTSSGHDDIPYMQHNLGKMYALRFEHNGGVEDLDKAVNVADMAVAATSADDQHLADRLYNLGQYLEIRFNRTGVVDDLNRAIDAMDDAVSGTSDDGLDRADALNCLAKFLSLRFQRAGLMDDLNRAVDAAAMAVKATPRGHPDRVMCLSNLGNCIGMRFERAHDMKDLDKAVTISDEVVADKASHPYSRAIYLCNLASWLSRRFKQRGLMEDLNRAVDAAERAVVEAAKSPQHRDRATFLSNLGDLLATRFEKTGTASDLEKAVKACDEAVATTPIDQPSRAWRLSTLGHLLHNVSKRFGQSGDLERAIDCFREAWQLQNASPSDRIHFAQTAAGILMSQSKWTESSVLLDEAVKLLSTVSPRFLEDADKQHILEKFTGLASMAAAAALNAGKGADHALGLLELGRGVIASLLMDIRQDTSKLKEDHPELEREFISLRDELDSPGSKEDGLLPVERASISRARLERRREADRRFHQVIEHIRTLPGFHSFIRPLSAGELMGAAESGPIVVVNVSSYRCDAFLVERQRIRSLGLPNLSLEMVRHFRGAHESEKTSLWVLQWLWDAAACPILEALDFNHAPTGKSWPHVWWILTGPLSHLPFHAAGRHFEGSTETVLDRVVSSYASSIKALIYGRRRRIQDSADNEPGHALLVSMRDTPCQSVLPYAEDEMVMLRNMCPLLRLRREEARRRDEVLEYLGTCTIFHFAGHGKSDPVNPSHSCLLLEDWENRPLTVCDLRDHISQGRSPFLGYLSACSTGANEADGLVDEAIHLANACQLAGFQHVISTLWEVSDKNCAQVATILYETIRDNGMTDTAVCLGLHRAVKTLRDRIRKMGLAAGDSNLVDRAELHQHEKDRCKARDGVPLGRENSKRSRGVAQDWASYVHFGT